MRRRAQAGDQLPDELACFDVHRWCDPDDSCTLAGYDRWQAAARREWSEQHGV